MARGTSGRPYIFELDPVRVVTALCVVGVHVAAAAVLYYQTPLGKELQNAAVSALHFTRETFLAISAFVLVYGYAHRRPFPLLSFWRKRGLGVVFPYVFWSVFYMWFSTPHQSWSLWLNKTGWALLLGTASFQLYFVLLTLEFYLLLPLFLWLLLRVARRPWTVLSISFVVQVVMMTLDYLYLQPSNSVWVHTGFGHLISSYRDQLLPLYQFYLVLGGVAALYVHQVRAWVLRHGAAVVLFALASLGLLWGVYAVQLAADPRRVAYAISVFQPTMVLYSLAVTVALYWVAYRWLTPARNDRPPPGYRLWSNLSYATFGIYLIHPFILTTIVLPDVAPLLPTGWPAALRFAIIWGLVAGSATAVTLALLYTPGLSRLVGHPWLVSAEAPMQRRLVTARQHAVAALRAVAADGVAAWRVASWHGDQGQVVPRTDT